MTKQVYFYLLLLLLFLLDLELVTILQVTFVILALVTCYETMSVFILKWTEKCFYQIFSRKKIVKKDEKLIIASELENVVVLEETVVVL